MEGELLGAQAELNEEVLKLGAGARDTGGGWGRAVCVGHRGGGPSPIHSPLMPVGNLLDRRAPSPPLAASLRKWTQWCGWVRRSQIEVFAPVTSAD